MNNKIYFIFLFVLIFVSGTTATMVCSEEAEECGAETTACYEYFGPLTCIEDEIVLTLSCKSEDSMYLVSNFNNDWDSIQCNENGCGYQEIPNPTYITCNQNLGDNYALICYDEDHQDWVWTGYGFTGHTQMECRSGSKCFGSSYLVCQNYQWVNKGLVNGQCGYTTPTCPNLVCGDDEDWFSCPSDCEKTLADYITQIFDYIRNLLSGTGSLNAVLPSSSNGGSK